MQLSRLRLLLLGALVLVSAPATAASSRDAFEAGVAAFRDGDYQQALDHFLAAQQAGLSSRALLYDLGATYFRLGRYAEAERVFSRLRDTVPSARTLATYNLGLIARARGDRNAAADYFRSAYEAAEDGSRLQRLADAALAATGKPVGGRGLGATGGLSVAAGHDDNVAFEPSGDRQEGGDAFLEAFGWARYRWAPGEHDRLRAEASVYSLSFADLHDYDLLDLHFGGAWLRRILGWRWELGGAVDRLWRDGRTALDAAAAHVAGRRPLGAGWTAELRYRATRYEAASRYDYLDGWRHELGPAVELDADQLWLRLAYSWAWNARRDETVGDRFYSYSPTVQALSLDSRWRLLPRWHLTAGADLRDSVYADEDVRQGSSGLYSDRREDLYWRGALGVERDLGRSWTVFAEYRHTDNDSNFDAEDYRRNVWMAGLRWQ